MFLPLHPQAKQLKHHTDNDGYFIIDPVNHTLYSSFTGKTIDFSEASEGVTGSNISPRAVGDVKETYTMKISYKSIANAIGTVTDSYDIAFTIAGIFAATQGIAITTVTLLVYGALKGQLLTTVLNGIKSKAVGGVKLTIKLVEIQRHQGGNIVKAYTYNLGGLSTYK